MRADGEAPSWICVDAVAMGDVDYSGGETLLETIAELRGRGVRLVFSDVTDAVRQELDRAGVAEVAGADAFYDSVEDVIAAHRAASR